MNANKENGYCVIGKILYNESVNLIVNSERIREELTMAEKKEKKIISADDGTVTTASEKKVKAAKPTGDAKKKRLVAVILWVVAIIFEVLAFLVVLGKVAPAPRPCTETDLFQAASVSHIPRKTDLPSLPGRSHAGLSAV
mgnify:CR=1 FL=1